MAELTSDTRNRLKSSQFALPGSRRYPINDKAHAVLAKARATQMVAKGKLSSAAASQIKAKANRKLTGVDQDLNYPGNRSPQTPLQEDINPYKSRPVTTRSKWQMNSQGKGAAADSGQGANYKSQPNHGGTQAPSANKKAVAKTGGTQETGKNYKGQEKFGGANGKRYANGSSSFDSMKGVIRDH